MVLFQNYSTMQFIWQKHNNLNTIIYSIFIYLHKIFMTWMKQFIYLFIYLHENDDFVDRDVFTSSAEHLLPP